MTSLIDRVRQAALRRLIAAQQRLIDTADDERGDVPGWAVNVFHL